MNARNRGPKVFLGVAVTALALVIAQHVGSSQLVAFQSGNAVARAAYVGTADSSHVTLTASTNLFVPGTGNPGETGSTNPGNEWVIVYPATQPVTGDYPGSVRAGVASLGGAVDATPLGSSVEIGGYSQGAHVVNEWAALPGATDGRDVTLVTTGDPCTARTGILVRSPEARAIAGPCSPLPPGITQVVIVQACDPITNFPEKLDLLTVANALAGYTYCHGGGYTSDQLNRPDIYTYQEGSVTYRVIPAESTSPLVRAMHQNGIFLPGDVEAGINAAVAQSGPGPQGGAGMVSTAAAQQVSAPVDVLPVPDPLTQARQAVDEGLQNVAEEFTTQVESFVANATMPVETPLWTPPPVEPVVPTGNIAAVAEVVESYVPAPEVAWAASQIQVSPLGAVLNGLPPLPFG